MSCSSGLCPLVSTDSLASSISLNPSPFLSPSSVGSEAAPLSPWPSTCCSPSLGGFLFSQQFPGTGHSQEQPRNIPRNIILKINLWESSVLFRENFLSSGQGKVQVEPPGCEGRELQVPPGEGLLKDEFPSATHQNAQSETQRQKGETKPTSGSHYSVKARRVKKTNCTGRSDVQLLCPCLPCSGTFWQLQALGGGCCLSQGMGNANVAPVSPEGTPAAQGTARRVRGVLGALSSLQQCFALQVCLWERKAWNSLGLIFPSHSPSVVFLSVQSKV